MKLAQLHGPRDLRVDDVPEPELGSGTVRISVSHCAICGSDLHEFEHGPVPVRSEESDHEIPESQYDEILPKPMGHEISGIVSGVADDVDKVSVGDKVVPNLVAGCGTCKYCTSGLPRLCTSMDGSAIDIPGFAENLVVPAETLEIIPEGVSLRHASLTEPLSVSLHGIRVADLSPADSIAVFGVGSIGLGVVSIADSLGVENIYVSEPRKARRELAEEVGATLTVDPAEKDPKKEIMNANGSERVDVSFEASGVGAGLEAAIRTARYRGTVVVLSVFTGKASIHPNDIMQSERKILGSFAYQGSSQGNSTEYSTILRMLNEEQIDPEPMITDVINLENITEDGFKRLIDPDSDQLKILVKP